MNKLEIYTTLIIVVKIAFIMLTILEKISPHIQATSALSHRKIAFWRERTEFIFIVMMAIFLIYLFSPKASRVSLVQGEIKLLIYLFGIVLLITADWKTFFGESPLLHNIQTILSTRQT